MKKMHVLKAAFFICFLCIISSCHTAPVHLDARPDFVWDPDDLSSGEVSLKKVAIIPLEIEIDRKGCPSWQEGMLAISKVVTNSEGKGADEEFAFRFERGQNKLNIHYWREVSNKSSTQRYQICPHNSLGYRIDSADCYQEFSLPNIATSGLHEKRALRVEIPDCRFKGQEPAKISSNSTPINKL